MRKSDETARAVAEGQADCGLGLEGAARPYGLGFIPLTLEQYDLVIPARHFDSPLLQALIDWLRSPAARQAISSLAGYQIIGTGEVKWI